MHHSICDPEARRLESSVSLLCCNNFECRDNSAHEFDSFVFGKRFRTTVNNHRREVGVGELKKVFRVFIESFFERRCTRIAGDRINELVSDDFASTRQSQAPIWSRFTANCLRFRSNSDVARCRHRHAIRITDSVRSIQLTFLNLPSLQVDFRRSC